LVEKFQKVFDVTVCGFVVEPWREKSP